MGSLAKISLRSPRTLFACHVIAALANWLNFASEDNAHDGIPVGLIEAIQDSSSFQN